MTAQHVHLLACEPRMPAMPDPSPWFLSVHLLADFFDDHRPRTSVVSSNYLRVSHAFLHRALQRRQDSLQEATLLASPEPRRHLEQVLKPRPLQHLEREIASGREETSVATVPFGAVARRYLCK